MPYRMYFLIGALNCLLVLIMLRRTMLEKDRFMDCKLFARLLIAVLLVDVSDTAGWLLDGRLTGGLSLITSVTDALNLTLTAAACWAWVQYVQYLAYEDAGMPGRKNYFSTIVFSIQAISVLVTIPTKLFYYIDANGFYCRSTGYEVYTIFCLIQLIYSTLLCFFTCRKVDSAEKRHELHLVGLIILLPICGTIVQGFFYGISMIWTCMTVLVVSVYIHIQDKRRVGENAKQREQLCKALQQAQYASKAKTEFLANMSHDIRTPMNAIVGFAAIAESHIDEKEIVKDSLTKITTSSKHLLQLINDILDMGRIESGKMQLQVVPCNLAELMHGLVDMIRGQITAKQLELFIDARYVRNEEILTDPVKLNQIFINLVGNAIKFNKPGGAISICIEQKDSTVANMGDFVFTVKDTGTGIAPKYLEHIFEPFERGVQDMMRDKVEGSGLGLAIVKNIVDMMGGTISVTSEPGKGSEFKIELSFGLQTTQDMAANDEKLRGLRALVVDGDHSTCESVTHMLQDIGMEGEWALTGEEAVLKAERASKMHKGYAAFIIERLLPDMNGIELTRRIKSEIEAETPAFILTAYDLTEIGQGAKDAGVAAFCRKPLFMSELRRTLAEAAGLAQASLKEEQSEACAENLRGKRILLAEDHPLNREIVVRLLSDKGLRVETAEDGAAAVEKFRLSQEKYYDLVLMDIRMPRMDGYQAAEHIRALAREDAKTVPIIAMTANAFDEDKKMALQYGMNAHLSKPLDVKELFAALEHNLQKE